MISTRLELARSDHPLHSAADGTDTDDGLMSELANFSARADHNSTSIHKGKGFLIILRNDTMVRQLQFKTTILDADG
jgi:hypothetical protein